MFGLYSKSEEEETQSECTKEYCDETDFLAYWKEETTPEYQSLVLDHLIAKLEQNRSLSQDFDNSIDPIKDLCPNYLDIVKMPICFRGILDQVDDKFYSTDFTLFEADVRLCFENEMLFSPVDHKLYLAAKVLLSRFEVMLTLFKNEQMKLAKWSVPNEIAKTTSPIALNVETRIKLDYLNLLLMLKGTLLVVPVSILNCWEVSGCKQHSEGINIHDMRNNSCLPPSFFST